MKNPKDMASTARQELEASRKALPDAAVKILDQLIAAVDALADGGREPTAEGPTTESPLAESPLAGYMGLLTETPLALEEIMRFAAMQTVDRGVFQSEKERRIWGNVLQQLDILAGHYQQRGATVFTK